MITSIGDAPKAIGLKRTKKAASKDFISPGPHNNGFLETA
jgi:hypothetical protein